MRNINLLHMLSLCLAGVTANTPPIGPTRKTFESTPTRLALSRSRAGSNGASLDPQVTVDVSSVALALTWTAEINHRLQDTAQASRFVGTAPLPAGKKASSSSPIPRGGAGYTYRIRDTAATALTQAPLTIFHAKTPRTSSDTGAGVQEQWGPELNAYLRYLQKTLRLSTLDLVLSMMYLDRACSLETPRSSGSPSLPFCTPRTMHRLLLTSITLAKLKTTPKLSTQELYSKIKPLGLSREQLNEMMTAMKSSLGDVGLFVSSYQMRDFEQTWQNRFPGSRLPSEAAEARSEETVEEEFTSLYTYTPSRQGDSTDGCPRLDNKQVHLRTNYPTRQVASTLGSDAYITI